VGLSQAGKAVDEEGMEIVGRRLDDLERAGIDEFVARADDEVLDGEVRTDMRGGVIRLLRSGCGFGHDLRTGFEFSRARRLEKFRVDNKAYCRRLAEMARETLAEHVEKMVFEPLLDEKIGDAQRQGVPFNFDRPNVPKPQTESLVADGLLDFVENDRPGVCLQRCQCSAPRTLCAGKYRQATLHGQPDTSGVMPLVARGASSNAAICSLCADIVARETGPVK